jgi:hypothetical protein
MHYSKKQKEEYDCEECGERVPAGKNHICENKDKKEEELDDSILVFTDDIPFIDSEVRNN